MTRAEQIADRYDRDGTVWEKDGVDLAGVLAEATQDRRQEPGIDVIRHVFSDGSAILEYPQWGTWDLEGGAPFESASAGPALIPTAAEYDGRD